MKRAAPGSDLRKKNSGSAGSTREGQADLEGELKFRLGMVFAFYRQSCKLLIAFVGQGPKSMNISVELNICKFQTIYLHLVIHGS